MYANLAYLKNKVNNLTTKPGVYLMKNSKDKVVYIGKAKNLKKRPCLNYYIKKCSGICCSKISDEDYKNSVNDAIKFLKDNSKNSINLMKKQMEDAANNKNPGI